MRAVVWGEGGALTAAEVPKPAPGPGEVRVRVRACGICGSDLHLRSVGFVQRGVAPGHEFAGVVDAVGPGVERLTPGSAVAVEPLRSCGGCDECRRGLDAICADGQLLGVHAHGGFAEYAVVAARRAFPVPADLDPRVAALAEPTAVAVRGLRRGGFAPGQRVLVLGAGSVGLLAALAARALGAGEVWVSARHAAQAALAKEVGATRVLGEAEASPGELARAGRAAPFDLVLETVGGSADTLNAAAAAVRRGGSVAVLGMFLAPVRLDTLPPPLEGGDPRLVVLLRPERRALRLRRGHAAPRRRARARRAARHPRRPPRRGRARLRARRGPEGRRRQGERDSLRAPRLATHRRQETPCSSSSPTAPA